MHDHCCWLGNSVYRARRTNSSRSILSSDLFRSLVIVVVLSLFARFNFQLLFGFSWKCFSFVILSICHTKQKIIPKFISISVTYFFMEFYVFCFVFFCVCSRFSLRTLIRCSHFLPVVVCFLSHRSYCCYCSPFFLNFNLNFLITMEYLLMPYANNNFLMCHWFARRGTQTQTKLYRGPRKAICIFNRQLHSVQFKIFIPISLFFFFFW